MKDVWCRFELFNGAAADILSNLVVSCVETANARNPGR